MVDERLVLINLVMCSSIFWACVCRLRMTTKRVYPRVRNRYVIIGTGSLCGGFGQWLFPFDMGVYLGLCIFVGAIALGFWLDKKDWDNGPPASATKPGELYDEAGNRIPYK